MPTALGMRNLILPTGERLTFWGEPQHPPNEAWGDLYVQEDPPYPRGPTWIFTHDEAPWDAMLYRNMLLVFIRHILITPGGYYLLGSWDEGLTWWGI